MSFDSTQSNIVSDNNYTETTSTITNDVEAVRWEIYSIIDEETEINFTNIQISETFWNDDFNYTLFPINKWFYFLRDRNDNLTDYAIVSSQYISESIKWEVKISSDACEIGEIANDSMYLIYAWNDRNNWKTLNADEVKGVIEKLKIDSKSQ